MLKAMTQTGMLAMPSPPRPVSNKAMVEARDAATYTENHKKITRSVARTASFSRGDMNVSACESASVVHVYSLTAIFKVPARRWF
jgi:hypothetical protein